MTTRRDRSAQAGFSAMEIVAVLLVLSILMLIIFVPGYMRMQTKAQEAQVRGNAINLQKMVELYRMNNFRYPASMADLDQDASERSYNMELENPFSGARGKVGSNKWSVKIGSENVPLPGFAGFKLLDPNHYEIYAYDRDGNLLLDVTGKEPYVLRSSK